MENCTITILQDLNVLKREYFAWIRKRRPYTSTNHLGQDTQLLNVARVARVWLGTMFYNFIFDIISRYFLTLGSREKLEM